MLESQQPHNSTLYRPTTYAQQSKLQQKCIKENERSKSRRTAAGATIQERDDENGSRMDTPGEFPCAIGAQIKKISNALEVLGMSLIVDEVLGMDFCVDDDWHLHS